MIPLSKNATIFIISIIAMLATSMAVGIGTPLSADLNLATLLPIVLIVEYIIYAGATFLTNTRASLVFVFVYSLAVLLIRGIIAFIGAFLVSFILDNPSGASNPLQILLLGWVGNLLGVVVQIIILLISMPHVIQLVSPALLDEEMSKSLGDSPSASKKRPSKSDSSAPSGGFIQVFSFEELAGVIKKTPGLEGFVIYSREGFVVWRDLPHKIAVEDVTVRLMQSAHQVDSTFKSAGLSNFRKMLIESREHLVFVSELNQNFGMMLFYNGRVDLAESSSKAAVMVKTAQEFVQWKYPGISLTTPMKAYQA